jgi:hypothetical protein
VGAVDEAETPLPNEEAREGHAVPSQTAPNQDETSAIPGEPVRPRSPEEFYRDMTAREDIREILRRLAEY